MRHLVVFLLSLAVSGNTVDPEDYPKDYFRSPLGIPLSLSGNFAEMRSNHFHAGLDIRTNAQTGYRVYAAAEGTIVRVAVSGGGYGNAVYLQHPNGYTTVYAHLERFEEPIASYVKQQQYAGETFEVNLFPPSGRFRFAQGDVIGYSGNSGSSGGPHLHFEIRDTATSEPLNPLFFGLPVQDTTRPRAYRVYVYAADPTSAARVVSSTGRVLSTAVPGRPAEMSLAESGAGAYAPEGGARIEARGRIAFAIQAHDYHDNSGSRLGLYRIDLTAGQRFIYRSAMERLNFSLQRYINAHLDYGERIDHGRWVQRSHLLPGNRLPLYETERDGFLDVAPGDTVPIRYDLRDAYGNLTAVELQVVGTDLAVPPPPARTGFLVSRDRPESFVQPGLIVRIPRGALYEDMELLYSSADRRTSTYSRLHTLHRASTPIHQSITLSIEADALPADQRDKALVARVSGDRLTSAGGGYDAGYVTTQTRGFGTFAIATDTRAPSIRALNISPGANMGTQSAIRFQISDDLSGIAEYEGLVDGEWVLFEHDPKRSLLYHTFDGRVAPGRHRLTLRVVDGKNNVATYEAEFTR